MFRNMKKILLVLCVLALCAGALAEGYVPRIVALKGPTAMGLVKLMKDDEAAGSYAFTIAAAVDEVTPMLVKGEAVQSVADLKGRTIYASGKGATPEYALNFILSQNGIDPEQDVTIEWKSEHAECLTALMASEAGVALLPQPFVTTALMKAEGLRVALDLNAAWDALGVDSTLITGVAVARRDFAEAHADALNAFLDAYRASVEYVNANTDDAAKLVGEYEIVPEQVAAKALPACNITFIEGAEMQAKLEGYLQVLLDANPKAVGGKLPEADFYYQR